MRDKGQEPIGLVYSSISPRSRSVVLHVMREDLVVHRPDDRRVKILLQRVEPSRPPRGIVQQLSQKSTNRLMQQCRNLTGFRYFITLTYPIDWRWCCATKLSRMLRPYGESVCPVSVDVTKYHFEAFREWLRRREVNGLWWVEFQGRGAPHYHLFVDRYVNKYDLSEAWYRIVGSGDVKHLAAGTNIRPIWGVYGAQKYLSKYAAKERQKIVPPEFGRGFGRFWGLIGWQVPRLEIYGSAEDLAKALRVFRHLARNRKYNSFASRGRERGFTLYGSTNEPIRYLGWLLDSGGGGTIRWEARGQKKGPRTRRSSTHSDD